MGRVIDVAKCTSLLCVCVCGVFFHRISLSNYIPVVEDDFLYRLMNVKRFGDGIVARSRMKMYI